MVSAANGLVSRNTARAGGTADRLDTCVPVTISPPFSRTRAASTLLICCEPPRIAGQPTACPAAPSTRPNDAVAGCVSGSIACAAMPEKSARARGARNRSRANVVAGASGDAETGEPDRVARDVDERPRQVFDERVPATRVWCERRAPARRVGTERRVGRGEAAVDDAGGAVVEWVREGELRCASSRPCALERQWCERRRTGRERMDGRAHVVPVAGQGQRFSARAAADLLGGFEQQHRIPRGGQERGRGEPVGPRADDDCVVLGLGVRGFAHGRRHRGRQKGHCRPVWPTKPKNDAPGLGPARPGPARLPPGPRQAPARATGPLGRGMAPWDYARPVLRIPVRATEPALVTVPAPRDRPLTARSPGDQLGSPAPPRRASPCTTVFTRATTPATPVLSPTITAIPAQAPPIPTEQ